MEPSAQPGASISPAELERFARLAADWWNPTGKFRPLHKFNPVRLYYIKQNASVHFGRDERNARALDGLSVLDIGCGGGLLCEPMARLGATVTGIDPGRPGLEAAKIHSSEVGLSIDYRVQTAEELLETGTAFDIVLCMEVVEHVPNVPAFLMTVCQLVKPGGLLFAATINRTPKAYILAIFGAERVLRWLPAGTHSYDKLVKPAELTSAISAAGLVMKDQTGVAYNPLQDTWSMSRDMAVNYMVIAERPQSED